MSWEKLEKEISGGRKNDGRWNTLPMMGINKGTLSINGIFCQTFGIDEKSQIGVFLDRKNRRIGIKVCTDEEKAREEGWRVQFAADQSKKSASVGIKKVAKAFPDCVGKIFLARLNPGERVIVAELGPAPMSEEEMEMATRPESKAG